MSRYPQWGVPPTKLVHPIPDELSPPVSAPSMIRLRDGVFAFVAYMGGQFVGAFLFVISVVFYWGVRGDRHVEAHITEAGTSGAFLAFSIGFSVVCVLLFAWMIAQRPGLSWRDLGFVMPKTRWFVYSLAAFVVSLGFSGLVEYGAGVELMRRANKTMDFLVTGDQGASIVMIVLVCAVVPFIEEIVFRAIIFRALANRLRPAVAAVFAVLIFALVHVQYLTSGLEVAVVMMLQVGFMGAGLVWLYHGSRSLWPGVLMHILNNSWVFVFLLYVSRSPA